MTLDEVTSNLESNFNSYHAVSTQCRPTAHSCATCFLTLFLLFLKAGPVKYSSLAELPVEVQTHNQETTSLFACVCHLQPIRMCRLRNCLEWVVKQSSCVSKVVDTHTHVAQYIIRSSAQLPQRWRGSAVITPLKVIQDHWFWYQSKAICNFLLVNNTN